MNWSKLNLRWGFLQIKYVLNFTKGLLPDNTIFMSQSVFQDFAESTNNQKNLKLC